MPEKTPVKILDSSFFFLDIPMDGEFAIPHAVEEELKDIRAKSKLEALKAQGLIVCEPSEESRKKAVEASEKSGDIQVISSTDTDVIALALELGGSVVTDDFALSNTAQTLGLKVYPLQMRAAKKRRWKYRCTGCRKLHDSLGECDVCGALIKRMYK
ncbi:nucleotide-binding protein [Methanomicrobium antiquum]|uniref:Nucleotide-binding protein n=1 Tax=Methanomicrobium antiquum TaxID=487686 RepID=A0AAF0FTX5_9EURY|nr:nucleotide-binding protein [Methanomicrobium antiquum]MDD4127867.1 nucleotide-binding protein [Methanomicrobium sp.]WFN36443.1 nucleotide-binding protein [Methanomicrobium antiquum]